MEFDNSQVVKHLATLPPEPPKREERSAWGAPFRAIKAAVADVMGSGADTVKGMSAGRMVEGRAPSYMNPLMAMPGDDMGAVVSPGSIDRGSMFRSDVGRSFRNVSEELRPDPMTASTAENVVFNVVRPLAKLAAGGILAGPAGLGLASAEEGFTQSEDLARLGVDVDTRAKVGTLTAGVTAATAGLPMAGSTLKATAALYLAGGPGGFMAQQAATRSILADANYEDLAKQYDPLDPLGLAVSTLIPLPFAAYGARANIRAMRKAEPEAAPAPAPAPARTQDDIDAAMAHNLTLRADVHEAAGKAPEVMKELMQAAEPVGGPRGRAGYVTTERGMNAQVQYRLVEASDLITSHTNDLAPADNFPAELQPRDRTRAASADQIARIENSIRPELLGESVKASDGAPIIGADAVVESGNARTIALRRAYESGKAENYRAWVAQNAEQFGLSVDQVAAMKSPVLVRERLGTTDRAEFARQANESAIAAMSPTEQAKADAARIADLSELVPNEDGSINMVKSAAFVRQFMQSAVSPTERGAMLQSDGRLSQVGQQRLRNAIFAKAYGDSDMIAMLAESTDSNVRNVLAGMMRAAPEVARLRDLQASGARAPMDIGGDIVQAVRQFSNLRAEGMSVDQFRAQGSLIDNGIPAQVQTLMGGLQDNSRAPKRIAEMLKQLVDTIDAMGDPRQAGMFDEATATQADVMAAAVERMKALTDDQITDTEPATLKPSTDPMLASIAERVATVEAAAGDLVVRTTEDGRPVTVADELAAVRREAAEGTDAELGALDADLVRVAAECALSMGST
jgi:hypothetical protein